jgi:hypothetical protein
MPFRAILYHHRYELLVAELKGCAVQQASRPRPHHILDVTTVKTGGYQNVEGRQRTTTTVIVTTTAAIAVRAACLCSLTTVLVDVMM